MFSVAPATLHAQEEGKPAPAAGEEKKEGAAPAKEAEELWIIWVCKISGFIGLVILICSIVFVAQVARLFYEFRMPVVVPPEIVSRCEELLGQRDFKGIYNVVKEDDSMFRIKRSWTPLTGAAVPTTGSLRVRSIEADLKLMTSMKNVMSWNTMSRIGVRFGLPSVSSSDMRHYSAFWATLAVAAPAVAGPLARAAWAKCLRNWSASMHAVVVITDTRLRKIEKK